MHATSDTELEERYCPAGHWAQTTSSVTVPEKILNEPAGHLFKYFLQLVFPPGENFPFSQVVHVGELGVRSCPGAHAGSTIQVQKALFWFGAYFPDGHFSQVLSATAVLL